LLHSTRSVCIVAYNRSPNKGMELTAYSVRSCVAPAFGSSLSLRR
jgi:hypothetical protein